MSKITRAPVKYVTNKELLAEIAKCKNSFCSFIDPEHSQYDTITGDLDTITREVIDEVLEKINSKAKTPRGRDGFIVRVMTHDHVPIDPERKRKSRVTNQNHAKTNFPPFKHFQLKERDDEMIWTEVGRSHWVGGFENGHFTTDAGRMTDRLGRMFMMLVNRYSMRSNWRGYCKSEDSEALTTRGWLNHSELTEDDTIMSYNNGKMTWSAVKSIYRGEYDGDMFRMTKPGFDALVTPNHKWVTTDGLKPIDYITNRDDLILMGAAEQGVEETHPDALVELVGWFSTEGSSWKSKDRPYERVSIYQNEGVFADRIRGCIQNLGEKWSETTKKKSPNNIRFLINKHLGNRILECVEEDKAIRMDFLLELSHRQRELLFETMIDGDGTRSSSGRSVFAQKSKKATDAFVALCSLLGKRTSTRERRQFGYGAERTFNLITIMSPKTDVTSFKTINLHGGKSTQQNDIANHPNVPTEYYKGIVWCPETEYGCFLARRNGYVYLTGNTYRDEMCGLALMHLSQVGLQFDESKSNNPFAFFTTTIMHCFTRQLTLEKKNQTIRDDLLINMGMAPSYTRQIDDEMNHGAPKKMPGKRGRKSAATIAAEAAVEKAKKESEERDF